jgi:ABC-2 type transport system permease protein
VYGAVFAFIGAAFRRPLLVGLVFIFGWEQAALAFPGYMRQLTVAYYLQALVPHAMPADGVVSALQGFFRDSPGVALSLLALTVIWAVFLALATWAVERREYVLEQ